MISSSTKLAVLAGKLATKAIKLSGMGMGSNLPGRIGQCINPSILGDLSSEPKNGIFAVSGTNGKSTTAGLFASILQTAGFKLVHNKQGANLAPGITASLIEAADWQGRIEADYGLFEIDEAALPVVAKEIHFKAVLVTNLFRDQLDRFGELDTTARLIARGIETANSIPILNADDPNVSQLIPGKQPFYFGLESNSTTNLASNLAELSYCSLCGSEIVYDSITYGQLGNWHCSKCNQKRPLLDLFANKIETDSLSSTFHLNYKNNSIAVHLPLPGLFNVYNAVAAAAAAAVLEVSLEVIKNGLQKYSTLFGRSERLYLSGKNVLIQLIKNPAGATQTLNSVSQAQDANVLIAINDNYADGRDVSWLWDAEFEQLAELKGSFIVSGQRAEDMALRLKYANIPAEKIKCIPSLEKALEEGLSQTKPNSLLWVLPTYTCLLELQKIFKQLGISLSGTLS